jgi:hypothetical protein
MTFKVKARNLSGQTSETLADSHAHAADLYKELQARGYQEVWIEDEQGRNLSLADFGLEQPTRKKMRQQPTEPDFTVNRKDASVDVLFKPTNSHYSFQLLADLKDIAKYGPLSPSVNVRHAGPTGDTDSL